MLVLIGVLFGKVNYVMLVGGKLVLVVKVIGLFIYKVVFCGLIVRFSFGYILMLMVFIII